MQRKKKDVMTKRRVSWKNPEEHYLHLWPSRPRNGTVPLENSQISEPTRIILPGFILRCLFFCVLLFTLPCVRLSVHEPNSNRRTWPCVSKLTFFGRSLKKSPKSSSGDRLFWVSLSRIGRDWPHRES